MRIIEKCALIEEQVYYYIYCEMQQKMPKNWKNSLYELQTELPLLLKNMFRHSAIAHVRCVAAVRLPRLHIFPYFIPLLQVTSIQSLHIDVSLRHYISSMSTPSSNVKLSQKKNSIAFLPFGQALLGLVNCYGILKNHHKMKKIIQKLIRNSY